MMRAEEKSLSLHYRIIDDGIRGSNACHNYYSGGERDDDDDSEMASMI